jgi:hypothetical protein
MALRFERKDGRSGEIDEAKVTKIAWRDDDGTEHDVEGHGFRRGLSDESDVEGHGYRNTLEDEPDVEGHGYRNTLEDEPDVEGHRFRFRREDEEYDIDLDKVVRIAWKDDDGTEHDVEGHRYRFS